MDDLKLLESQTQSCVVSFPLRFTSGFDSAVVTGGSGALGTLVASFMRSSCPYIMLLSRSGAARGAAEVAGEGGLVASIRCDVASAEEVASVPMPRVGAGRTVLIHASGVLADGTLANQTPASFNRAFAPKLTAAAARTPTVFRRGALAFHAEAHFSSVAALLGSAGQSSYAAANAALDSAVAKKAEMGVAASAVQWGPWAGAGMAAAHAATARRLESIGLTAIPESPGLRALGALCSSLLLAVPAGVPLAAPGLFTVAAGMDLARLASSGPAPAQEVTRALLSALLEDSAAAAGVPFAEEPRTASAVAPAPSSAGSAAHIRDVVFACAERLVGRPVEAAEPLSAAGLDSLGALELRGQLASALGVELPATLAYDYPTAEAIASFASELLGGTAQPDLALTLLRPGTAVESEPCFVLSLGGARTGELFGHEHALQDGVRVTPLSRWDVERGAVSWPRFLAALLEVELFDAELFSVAKTEAAVMDPHQRMLLQVRIRSS